MYFEGDLGKISRNMPLLLVAAGAAVAAAGAAAFFIGHAAGNDELQHLIDLADQAVEFGAGGGKIGDIIHQLQSLLDIIHLIRIKSVKGEPLPGDFQKPS